MINSDKFVPKAYSKSRDYQVFLRLFDLVFSCIKSDIDNYIGLISPDKCTDQMLPLLATYVGYKYDYNESYKANRLIIKYYPYLIRNRGSEIGIRLAAALSVNAIGDLGDIESLALFRIEYEKKDNKINVYIYYPGYLRKIRDLIEVVRPAGIRVELIPAEPIDTIDKVNIHDYMYIDGSQYSGSDRYKIGEDNRVGFGEVAKNKNG